MTIELDRQLDLVEATGRLTLYSLLAGGLAFPTAERIENLRSRLIPAASMLELPESLGDLIDGLTSCLPRDLESARLHYMALFPPIASRDAPGYETAYRGDGIFQQSELMADIAGFYRAHGLRAGGPERERVDHITVELEFLAFVARKETLAIRSGSDERAAMCRDTAALFLQDHLGCWGPSFGRRSAAVTRSSWLREIGHLVALWIEHDMAAFGVEPAEIVEDPLPQDPPDDGSCGPCPTGVTP